MSCWIMPSHFGSGYLPDPAGSSLPCSASRCATYAVASRLFVVPEHETNRAIGLHVGAAEHARELHHERRTGAVVVRRLTPADAVHVAADDVHLVRMRGADLRAVHLLPLAG